MRVHVLQTIVEPLRLHVTMEPGDTNQVTSNYEKSSCNVIMWFLGGDHSYYTLTKSLTCNSMSAMNVLSKFYYSLQLSTQSS